MIFGELPLSEAEGAILAHSVRHQGGMFKKGRTLTADDIAVLTASGVAAVFAAKLSADDVPEDEAAATVARITGAQGTVAQAPFTGRANLHATAHGLAIVDTERVRALNRLHESLTLATVQPFSIVEEREMVATVKVIPFAVPRLVLDRALAIIGNEPLLRVEAFRNKRAGLVITKLPQTKPSIVAKSEESIRERIAMRWAARWRQFGSCPMALPKWPRRSGNCRTCTAIPSWSSALRPSSTGATSFPWL
jgi:molybdenum cofactor cytidylyltransferase